MVDFMLHRKLMIEQTNPTKSRDDFLWENI